MFRFCKKKKANTGLMERAGRGALTLFLLIIIITNNSEWYGTSSPFGLAVPESSRNRGGNFL